jgi:hypothetical protein
MSKTFCPLPFTHLATHPIGTVSPCCSAEMNNGISTAKVNGKNMHLGEFSIAEIYNSEKNQTTNASWRKTARMPDLLPKRRTRRKEQTSS